MQPSILQVRFLSYSLGVKMKNVLALLTCFFLVLSTPVSSQEFQKRTPPTQESKRAVLIINSDNVSMMLLVDTNGRWISEARQIKMTTKLGTKPKVACKIYRGLYEPSNPEEKSWELSGIVGTDNEQFKVILDDLQDGTYDKGR